MESLFVIVESIESQRLDMTEWFSLHLERFKKIHLYILQVLKFEVEKPKIWILLVLRQVPIAEACLLLPVHVISCFSHVWLFATLWTIARQAPLSLRFSREEYWSGLPCPPPGDLPTQGLNPYLYVSYTGRWVLYNYHHQGSPYYYLEETKVQKPHKQLKRSKFPVLQVKANIR